MSFSMGSSRLRALRSCPAETESVAMIKGPKVALDKMSTEALLWLFSFVLVQGHRRREATLANDSAIYKNSAPPLLPSPLPSLPRRWLMRLKRSGTVLATTTTTMTMTTRKLPTVWRPEGHRTLTRGEKLTGATTTATTVVSRTHTHTHLHTHAHTHTERTQTFRLFQV